jgi:molybdopterin converting factor small subunit
MRVLVPNPLLSYTGGARSVDASGANLAALLYDLDARYPGMRFRMVDEQDSPRPHIKFFVNAVQARALETPLRPGDEVMIVAALSGG